MEQPGNPWRLCKIAAFYFYFKECVIFVSKCIISKTHRFTVIFTMMFAANGIFVRGPAPCECLHQTNFSVLDWHARNAASFLAIIVYCTTSCCLYLISRKYCRIYLHSCWNTWFLPTESSHVNICGSCGQTMSFIKCWWFLNLSYQLLKDVACLVHWKHMYVI